jgi:hypothetical protein
VRAQAHVGARAVLRAANFGFSRCYCLLLNNPRRRP